MPTHTLNFNGIVKSVNGVDPDSAGAVVIPVGGPTLYTDDDSLTGDRILNGTGHSLAFDNLGQFIGVVQALAPSGQGEYDLKGTATLNTQIMARWYNAVSNLVTIGGQGRLTAVEFYSGNPAVIPGFSSPFFPGTQINMGSTAIVFTTQIQVGGNIKTPYIEISADYTATINNYTINCTANSPDVTLFDASLGGAGNPLEFVNSGSGVLRLVCSGAELINGTFNFKYVFPGESCLIRSTTNGWRVIAETKAYNYPETVAADGNYQSNRLIGAKGITMIYVNGTVLFAGDFTFTSLTGETDIPVLTGDRVAVVFY